MRGKHHLGKEHSSEIDTRNVPFGRNGLTLANTLTLLTDGRDGSGGSSSVRASLSSASGNDAVEGFSVEAAAPIVRYLPFAKLLKADS